jgi:hypothetical protein
MRRDQTRLALIREQINAIEQARLARLEQVSRITLSDGLLIAEFNGLPSSASQVL